MGESGRRWLARLDSGGIGGRMSKYWNMVPALLICLLIGFAVGRATGPGETPSQTNDVADQSIPATTLPGDMIDPVTVQTPETTPSAIQASAPLEPEPRRCRAQMPTDLDMRMMESLEFSIDATSSTCRSQGLNCEENKVMRRKLSRLQYKHYCVEPD